MMITANQNNTKSNQAHIVPRVYSIREGAAMLGISIATVYRLVKAGRLNLTKIGGRSMLSDEEITRVAREGA